MLFCPITVMQEINEDDLADVWQTIDWDRMGALCSLTICVEIRNKTRQISIEI